MKKRFIYLFLAALLLLCSGCHNGSHGEKDSAGKEESGTPETVDEQAAGEVWQDNTLDLYTGQFNRPLKPVQSEEDGEIRTLDYALEASRATVFVRQLIPGESQDSLNIVTRDGEWSSRNLKEYDLNLLESAGKICGSGGYVLVDLQFDGEGSSFYRFLTVDENLKVTGSFDMEEGWPEEGSPSGVMADSLGNIHLVTMSFSGWKYYVLDSQGEILAEVTEPSYDDPVLVSLYDGSIALYSHVEEEDTGQATGGLLWKADPASGKKEILGNVPADIWVWDMLYFTLWDEHTFLYADKEGLYRGDLTGGNPELLYEWVRHGIQPQSIEDLQVGEDQSISLLYKDVDGMNYLYLEPTAEQREIHEITMAVSSGQMGKYKVYAARFTKMYPNYVVRLEETEYNDTRLMTELIAGKGPVLIDTFLTGFTQHEELWEPLDQVLEQDGLPEELILKALERGKIGETQYGIVDDFYIETVITASADRDDWDYDGFLEEIAARPRLDNICNARDSISFISSFFIHGLNDNYMVDPGEGVTYFDSDGFRRILHYAGELDNEDNRGYGLEAAGALKDGSMLCYEVSLLNPEDLGQWQTQLGDSLKLIGYPGRDGAHHYIVSSEPVAVRAKAPEEDKQIARLFLQSILTYDSQCAGALDIGFHMSVRKDVFEEQLMEMTFTSFYEGFDILKDMIDRERMKEDYMALLEQAVPVSYLPRELLDIITEELENYFSGVITEEQAIDHLKNRVELYLMEQK